MKKALTLILALAIGFGLKAQCPLTEAVDFTATDCHGTEVHLFDILDSGQAVLIDFFYTTCGPCQQATPKVVESYYAMGCNMHDVYYMEITCRSSDTDEVCQTWCQTYGVEYPTISGPAGGVGICNTYGIGAYPTVILIMPNHQIVIQDLWPINNAQSIITALEAQGLQQHDCDGGGSDIMPDFTATDINGNTIHLYEILDAGQAVLINFFLNGDEYSEAVMPDMIEAYRLYGCNTHDVFFMEICPNAYDEACQAWVDRFGVEYPTISRTGGGNDIAQDIPVGYYPTIMLIRPDHTFANRDIYPPTLEYIINAMNAEGYEQHDCPMIEELVFSTDTIYIYADCIINPDMVNITNMTSSDVQIIEYNSPEFNVECTYNEGSHDLAGAIIAPTNSLMVSVWASPNNYTGDLVVYGTLNFITSAGNYALTIRYEYLVGLNETNNEKLSLFPNPANDFVTLSGENLGTVRVYNTLGQKVDEFEANGSELRINTTGYENGVYFVKTDEKTMKLVVKH
jgi:peroxiredoxin